MPARIVLAHDDPSFVADTVKALRAAGYEVAAFTDTMLALDALETARRVEVLITRVRFAAGMPNGVALSRMARVKRPGGRSVVRRAG
jgi:DNA-binding NtrC family response regulator